MTIACELHVVFGFKVLQMVLHFDFHRSSCRVNSELGLYEF